MALSIITKDQVEVVRSREMVNEKERLTTMRRCFSTMLDLLKALARAEMPKDIQCMISKRKRLLSSIKNTSTQISLMEETLKEVLPMNLR